MAMLLKLQEAANYIESPDKEDPSLPKLWTQGPASNTQHFRSYFSVRCTDTVHIQERVSPQKMVVGVGRVGGGFKLSFPQ